MASLKKNILLKLLQEMQTDENPPEDNPIKHVLLQIRSIIPVLEENDLWPNKGFLLNVSDSSHALYVSLPQEQNELILNNQLKLGQFIHVHKLENAEPVPILKGVTPVQGRRQCEGNPEDIVSPLNVVNFLEKDTDSVVEKGVISEKTISKNSRKSTDYESLRKRNERVSRERFRSLSPSKTRVGEFRTGKIRPSSIDNDSDTESVLSSTSSMNISRRRSWNQSEILGVKEIFDSLAVKDRSRPPIFRSRSANVSPVRSIRYDSSDDSLSVTSRKRDTGSGKRLIKSTTKGQTSVSKVNNVHLPNSLVYDRKGAEVGISWNSLPLSLVKIGKEVMKQRDIALLAAADALQEACAGERLLSSLSAFSNFNSSEPDDSNDIQTYMDKLFDLHDNLSRTRLIMQSLTSISPFKPLDSESHPTNSIKETLDIALERKKNARTWIKSAVTLDLSTTCPDSNPSNNPTKNVTKSSDKSKGVRIVKKNVINPDHVPFVLSSEKDDNHEWTKGSTISASADLATFLQDEFRKLFLGYLETYLDEIERKMSSIGSDDQMAGTMYKVKMASDWLDLIANREGNSLLEDSEMEASGRLRNKIYGILMKNVERTAMAFERIKTSV